MLRNEKKVSCICVQNFDDELPRILRGHVIYVLE